MKAVLFGARTEVEETNDDLSISPLTRHVRETGYLALYEKIKSHRGRNNSWPPKHHPTRKIKGRITCVLTKKTEILTNITNNNTAANVSFTFGHLPTSYAYSKQFLTHLVTADVTVMPYNWPRDGEASSVRLYEVVSATHTHSLRYDARPYTAVTGILKTTHLYGANTICLYFASHNKTYPEWHVSQNKFEICKL